MSKQIKIRQGEFARLGRLLNMMYRPSELASELDCKTRRVRTLIDAGCPHVRDDTGHLWINGHEFRCWAETYNKGNRQPLGEGEAYCLRCDCARMMKGPFTTRTTRRGAELLSGVCSVCGTRVNRIQSSE